MTLKQLKAFLAVAETLSFAEASNRVFLSQPALSMSIKGLEESLGGRLIVRTTRTVTLTPEGKALYAKGRRLLNEWESLEQEMLQRFKLQRGTVSIAAMPSFASSHLPEILAIYRQKFPNINVQVHDVIAEETVEMVRTGKVELGVTFRPPGLVESDEFNILCEDKFVSVIPRNHPLSINKSVSWKELLRYDFIALQKPSMVRVLVDNKLIEAGIELNVAFESHQFATVGRMVTNDLGVSVVPSLCTLQMEELGTKVIPVHSPSITSELGILTRQSRQLSVAAQTLFDVFIQFYSSKEG